MVDLDDIERVCNFLMATGRSHHIPTQVNAGVTKELITRLRQAEKDAARYKDIITDCRGVFVIAGDAEMVSTIDEAVK